ncbi:uncharacterized protein FA14DRAFT_189127 [Meira miltonrushii]|uniref:NADH-ubiquinone oxidoreductase 9.5 kDa subunit n=1 Tax=Meira miltonrushii TaxID=1280837 RepID=A0A316VCB4_9BASI|nr:uncharacterized protein FA14DRAFT_189127 [Meira miltonrushii]PWN35120.1 hypothetical protein FA14DRAFT_189127 [Meira miltonrushii]
MSSIGNPFRSTFKYLQRQAHENPTIFFAIIIGAVGPVAVVTVPPIRRSFGWVPTERIPSTFPLPDRPREQVTGYDD